MRRRDTIAAIAVLTTVTVGVLAVGGSTRFTAIATALLGCLCTLPFIRSRRAFSELPALVALVVVATVATLVQLIPLPFALASVLSPEKAQLVAANAVALSVERPGWVALSYEPSQTWLALASLVGYLGVVIAAVRVAATSRGRLILARGLVAIAILVALIGIVHQVAGSETLFGLYSPREFRVAPRFLAPLMNPNHLAGFLAIATPIAIALAVAELGPKRLLWGGGAAVCGGTSLLLQSRTASVALLVGIAVVAAFLVVQRQSERRRHHRNRANRVAAAIVIATVFISALAYFGRGVAVELAETDVDELTGERGKLAVWRASTALVWDFKLVGAGRGAFEHAFTPEVHDSRFRYSHVENEALQAAIDWGLPLALFLFGLLVVALRRASGRAGVTLVEAGLFSAVVVAGIHSVADFAIELPGPALFVLVAFAGCSRSEITSASAIRGIPIRGLRLGLVVGSVALVGLAATSLGRGPSADSARVSATVGSANEVELALESWERHPAYYIAAGQAADALARGQDQRAFRVAARALAINPTYWQLHLTVARMLRQTARPSQALGEYRLAATHAPNMDPIVAEMAAKFPEPRLAVRGLPSTQPRITATAVALRKIKRPAIALAWLREMTVAYPQNAKAAELHARSALNRRYWSEAAAAGQRAFDLGERSGIQLAASALLNADQAEDAAALIDGVRSDPKSTAPSNRLAIAELRTLARARSRLAQPDLAAKALEQAISLWGPAEPEAAQDHSYLAEMQERMGHFHQAEKSRETAAQLRGKSLNGPRAPGN